jgi:hypothetical protein
MKVPVEHRGPDRIPSVKIPGGSARKALGRILGEVLAFEVFPAAPFCRDGFRLEWLGEKPFGGVRRAHHHGLDGFFRFVRARQRLLLRGLAELDFEAHLFEVPARPDVKIMDRVPWKVAPVHPSAGGVQNGQFPELHVSGQFLFQHVVDRFFVRRLAEALE